MQKHLIQEQATYETFSGAQYYVHEITAQRVSYCKVGELDRRESSLGRFAAVMERQIPNQ